MRVAITGGIAEGKSTVLSMLAEAGHPAASADAVAREILSEPATRAALAEIAGLPLTFAPSELRQAIAASEAVRRAVNRLMHPAVMDRLAHSGATFFEVPLLVEACLQDRFDRIWVVTCGHEEQRRRLILRYGGEEHVDRMLAAQLPTRAKLPFADLIVRTNAPLDHVRRLLFSSVAELGAS